MKKMLLGIVCFAAVVLVAGWFFVPVADAGADDKKNDSSLLAKIPAGYVQKAHITILEWELIKATPALQASIVDAGVAYIDWELDVEGGRIILKFFAAQKVWDRKAILTMAGIMVKARFPDIKSEIWVFQVVDIFVKRTYRFENGKWHSKSWDQKKKQIEVQTTD